MKTRSVKSTSFLKSSILTLTVLFGLVQMGMTQQTTSSLAAEGLTITKETPRAKNTIRLTPLKAFIFQRANIGYERVIYKNIHATVEAEAWFLDHEITNILHNRATSDLTNKGARFALGARYYSTTEIRKKYILSRHQFVLW